MRQIVDILETLVNGLTFTQSIKNEIDNGDGTVTIEVCCTYWVQPDCSTISIDGNEYRVVGVVHNESITFRSNGLTGGTEYVIEPPKYFHETRIKMNNTLSKIKSDSEKVPFIYVFEIINERFDKRKISPIDRTADLVLLFCGRSNYRVWNTDDHYQNAIIPMRSLVEKFLEAIDKDKATFADFDNYNLINHPNMGVYKQNIGHTESFFNENLSGVEMRVSLPIRKKKITCSVQCNTC